MAQLSPAIERGPSTLASNNPFRNRVSPTTTSPSLGPIGLATTTNPFLDASEVASPDPASKTSPTAPGAQPKPAIADTTAAIFAGLDINDSAKPRVRDPPPMKGPPRRENVAPPHGRPPPPRHKLSASDEERRRQQSKNRGQPRELDIFADPPDMSRPREKRPQRRNSESSIRDKPKDMDPEAEKRRRERRLREGKSSSRSKHASRKLDIIDKLDVTSIYGTGLFHHDGPFDACNPHRNRKGSRQAPMQAFPKNSTNMQLGGSGPVNPKLNLDQYHGTEREAHNDYNEAAIVEGEDDYYRRPQPERSASFNPTARIEPVHGSLSAGLGTSTFLEGTPASRAAIQRRESEYEASQREATANGLSRTKSLAQRIKSVRPKITDGPRVNSPELAATPTSPLGSGKPDQSGTNPFFKDYDKDYEKKGAQIAFAEEQQKTGRARAPSSPKRGLGLERKLTADSTNPEEIKPSTGGGFLTRMKSLKTPRRPRERRNTETS